MKEILHNKPTLCREEEQAGYTGNPFGMDSARERGRKF